MLEAGAGAEVGHLEQDGAVAGLGLSLGLVVAPGVGGAGQVGVPQPGVEQPRPQLRPALGLGLWCRQPRDVEAGMVRGRLVAGQRSEIGQRGWLGHSEAVTRHSSIIIL